MDLDLILDVFGYLPEKYFVSRLLLKNFQTRVSFVDYERIRYTFSTINCGWASIAGYMAHQEYGPAINYDDARIWIDRRRGRHRVNGPALFFRDPDRYFAKTYVISGITYIFYSSFGMSVPAEKMSDAEAKEIKEAWYECGLLQKIRTKSGKLIEL